MVLSRISYAVQIIIINENVIAIAKLRHPNNALVSYIYNTEYLHSVTSVTAHLCLLESMIECLAGLETITPAIKRKLESDDVPPSLSSDVLRRAISMQLSVGFLHRRRGDDLSVGALPCSCWGGGEGRGTRGEDIERDGDGWHNGPKRNWKKAGNKATNETKTNQKS